MAIAFDAAAGGNSGGSSGPGNPYNFNGLTVGSGANRILIAGVTGDGNTNGDITSVVWDQGGTNQSLTQLGTAQSGGSRNMTLWYVVAPTSGNKTLRVSVNGSTDGWVLVACACYTGVDQTTPIDSHADHAGQASPITATTTVVASNCWLVLVAADTTGSCTAGSSTTQRAGDGLGGNITAIMDSNATVGTGAQSLHATGGGTPAWNILSLLPSGGGGGGGTVTVTTPTAFHTYQRSGTAGTIAISGTVTGIADGQHIEASFNGGAFSSLGAISGGAFSGTLTTQAQGQGTLTVRHTETPADLTTVASIGIGDVFVCVGDSIAQGRGTNAKSTVANGNSIKAACYESGVGWKSDDDPTSSGTSNGSFWPLVGTTVVAATSTYPVAFINVGVGSSALVWPSAAGGLWTKAANTNYAAMVTAITAAAIVNPPKGFLVHLGANDSIDSSTESIATYKTAAAQLVSDLRSDYSGAIVFWAQLGDVTTGTPPDRRAALDNIREAIREVWNGTTGAWNGPVMYDVTPDDGVHFTSDASVAIMAGRWAAAIIEKFYSGAAGSGRGPTLASLVLNAARDLIIATFNVPTTPITPQTSVGGFRVYDGGTVSGATVTATRLDNSRVALSLSSPIAGAPTLSLGSGLDVADNGGANLTPPKDSSSLTLPNEAFVQQPVATAPIAQSRIVQNIGTY